ncbi:copper chaperone [Zobellella taiwanensis]|uniref:Copper chaperone n=3 Tax=Aeromonadaceae TaxID=84642 RepID=A0A2P7QMH4_9GAMM|nr:copper chaperone [Zobellella taiwanensis]
MVNFQVNDMTCGHCAGVIRAAITTAAPQADIEVDLSARRVAVEGVTDIDAVERAIREAGYTPELFCNRDMGFHSEHQMRLTIFRVNAS